VRARCVGVETADGYDARLGRNEVDDRRPSMRIPSGRDNRGRLVQQDIRERLTSNALAVQLDDVVPSHDRVEFTGAAVHPDTAVAYQLVRPAPRRYAGSCEECVEPHCAHCRPR
jgi:hypothetical protein